MYQERLRHILVELEHIQQDIVVGITIDSSMLDGIKDDNLDYLELVTDRYISAANEAIETLIDRLNGDHL